MGRLTRQVLLERLGTTLAGKYTLTALLGAGGMGAVYAARDTWTGRDVAIKTLLPRVREPTVLARFFREARIGAVLDHPHIVAVHDLGRADDGSWFIVQALLTGESLDRRLADEETLTPAQALEILVPIASALVATHARGVIHRDLKPANIFLRRDPRPGAPLVPTLIDFGISKVIDADAGAHAPELEPLTDAGEFVGTPAYMAPEQVRAETTLGPPVDVWALGAVLYRTLAARPPFVGTLTAVLDQITARDPEPLRRHAPLASPALEQVVHRALQRDPRARFPDMASLLGALLALPELERDPRGPDLRQRHALDAATVPDLRIVSDDTAPDTPAVSDAAVAAIEAGATLLGAAPPSAPAQPAPPPAGDDPGASGALAGFGVAPPPGRSGKGEGAGFGAAPPPGRSAGRAPWIVAGLVVVIVVGAVLAWSRAPREEGAVETAASAAEPDEAGSAVDGIDEIDEIDGIDPFDGVCRAWALALLGQQLDGGAFSGIIHLPPTGWATAQSLAGLVSARAACREAVPQPALEAAHRALDGFSQERGWGEFDGGEETLAAAWIGVLSADALRDPLGGDDDAAADRLRRARALLLAAQRADGGFADRIDPASDGYQSVMALWALVEAERVDPHPPSATARRRGLTWLRAALDLALDQDHGELAGATALVAQAAWVLALAQRIDGDAASDDPQRLERAARRLVRDCRLEPAAGCQRPLDENDRDAVHAPNEHRSGLLTLLWAPWTLVAVDALRTTPGLDEALRHELDAIAAWGARAIAREQAALANESGFVLSEWLFAVGRLRGAAR